MRPILTSAARNGRDPIATVRDVSPAVPHAPVHGRYDPSCLVRYFASDTGPGRPPPSGAPDGASSGPRGAAAHLMNTVAVVSDKGGSGKSTASINLAVQASKTAPTLVVDTDPQASVAVWAKLRPAELVGPKCVASTAHKLPQLLAAARHARFRWTLIDTAPGEPPAARVAVESADLVLIPIKPDIFNFAAILKTVAMVRSLEKTYRIFINDAPPMREGRQAPLVRAIRLKLHETGYRDHFGKFLWNAQITRRNVVPSALNRGLGIVEAGWDELAEQEFRCLWRAVAHLLEAGSRR